MTYLYIEKNIIDLESSIDGDKLRIVRLHLGLSRPNFAYLIQTPPTTIKNYECKYRELGFSAIKKMANHPDLAPYVPFMLDENAKVKDLYKATLPSMKNKFFVACFKDNKLLSKEELNGASSSIKQAVSDVLVTTQNAWG